MSEVEWVGRIVEWRGRRCAVWVEMPSCTVVAFEKAYEWIEDPLMPALARASVHRRFECVAHERLRVAPEHTSTALAHWVLPLVVAPTDDVEQLLRARPELLDGAPTRHWYLRAEPDPFVDISPSLVRDIFAASAKLRAADPWPVLGGYEFQLDVPTLDAVGWCGQVRRHPFVAASILMAPSYSEVGAVVDELFRSVYLSGDRALVLRLLAIEFLHESEAPRDIVARATRARLPVDSKFYPFGIATREGGRIDRLTERDANLLLVLVACGEALLARCGGRPGNGVGVFSVTAPNGHTATVRFPHPESPRLPGDTLWDS